MQSHQQEVMFVENARCPGVCADLEELGAEVREASDLCEARAGEHCWHVLIWHRPCRGMILA